ncbi:MAG: hypothetical protein EB060_06980 [Proteobacteria bacterium]|nr:hypothetical protein [Pseudomonadota bacterium]
MKNPFDLAVVLAYANGNEDSIKSDDARTKKLAIVFFNTAVNMIGEEPYVPDRAVSYIRGIQSMLFDDWEKVSGYYVKECKDGDMATYVKERLSSLVAAYSDTVPSYKPIEVVRTGMAFESRTVRVLLNMMDSLREAIGLSVEKGVQGRD